MTSVHAQLSEFQNLPQDRTFARSFRSENPDQFGLLMEDGSALKECVDAAIEELTADGTLAAIEAEWLAEATGVPVIE